MATRTHYDVVIVGGGHNGLVAAAYLARAGRSVLLLEQREQLGGATFSSRLFDGIDAWVSRYSYLVSLLPPRIVHELGLRFTTKSRRISSYTPVGTGGLLLDAESSTRTRESFARLTGSDREYAAWQRFSALTGEIARGVFPTLTEPLPTRNELRAKVGAAGWDAVFERPLGETVEAYFADDTVRGVVLTDALIGTFTHAHDPMLEQNRCFLYHVIGGGTGDWNVPVGGMGALTDALVDAARSGGAELVAGQRVTGIDTDGRRAEVRFDTGAVSARHVLVNAAPYELGGLLGVPGSVKPEGAQLKMNMVMRKLPRLRDREIDPDDAFSGTFHVGESYTQLQRAYEEAASGRFPSVPPAEIYCHTLTDPTILGPNAATAHTLTLFGLHTPGRLFADDPDRSRRVATEATLDQLDTVLAEPIRDCLAVDASGRPCLEVRTPADLEDEIGLPGGHIFHGDLSFPYRDVETNDPADPAMRWGVATAHANVLLCGAGAVRGGGVSGLGGHNAAMAVLEATAR